MSVSVSTGATVRFEESEFEARIISIAFSGIERTPIEVSRMSGAERQFWTRRNSDSGEFEIVVQFNPDTIPPFAFGRELVSVTWPNLERWSGQMFTVSYKNACALDDVMQATLTLKIAGPVTVVALTPLKNDDNDSVYNDAAELVYVGA